MRVNANAVTLNGFGSSVYQGKAFEVLVSTQSGSHPTLQAVPD